MRSLRTLADSDVALLIAEQPNIEVKEIINLAYHLGKAQIIYGVDSAVSVGLRRGLDDAIKISVASHSETTVKWIIRLGRRHGILFRF